MQRTQIICSPELGTYTPYFIRIQVVTREMQKVFIKARLSKVLFGLVVAVCPTLIGPGEVDDGNLEEGVADDLLVMYTFI